MTVNEFGSPLLTRKSEIARKIASTKTNFPIEVMGKYQRLPQITVRLGMPVYRMENGRTRTLQREYLAKHPDAPADLFTFDPDSLAAQKAQHAILQQLAEDEGLYKEFSGETLQTEPIIVTSTGVVVNGNRRLCVWRTLYAKDPAKYKRFEYIEIAVLPEDCDEAEIRALEKRLQIQKTHRAEYKWHTRAAMMKEEREAGATDEFLAKTYDVSKKEVDVIISALDYAEIYLQKIGKRDQWSLVDDDEYAFTTFVQERHKITDQGKKELFETVCFRLIEKKDYQGRLYDALKDIAKNLDEVAAELQAKGLIPGITTPSTTATSVAATTTTLVASPTPVSVSDDDDLDLLSGEETTIDPNSALATAIQTTDVKIGGLVKQVLEEQRSIKREQESAQYLVNTLAKVSKLLWNAETNGLNESTSTDGVSAQIAAIKERIDAIEKWLQSK